MGMTGVLLATARRHDQTHHRHRRRPFDGQGVPAERVARCRTASFRGKRKADGVTTSRGRS